MKKTITDFFNNYGIKVKFVPPHAGINNKVGIKYMNLYSVKRGLDVPRFRLTYQLDRIDSVKEHDFNSTSVWVDEYNRFFNRLTNTYGLKSIEVFDEEKTYKFITEMLGVTV